MARGGGWLIEETSPRTTVILILPPDALLRKQPPNDETGSGRVGVKITIDHRFLLNGCNMIWHLRMITFCKVIRQS